MNFISKWIGGAFVILLLLPACSSSETVTRERVVERTPEGEATSERTLINDEEVRSLRTEWEEELITAEGAAPVTSRYEEESRNVGLARRGAIVDAQRNLAQQISEIELTETVTMRDLETSDFVQTRLSAVLRDVEVLTERHDETEGIYRVTVQMPKVNLYRIIEEYSR